MTTSNNQGLEELYEFGPFRVDPAREMLLKEGVTVPLTPKTFQILLVLVRHGKEIVTKDDLMKTVWPDTFVEEANLSRNIFMLRKALGETAQDHRYIVTVPGRGYRLAEHVHTLPGEEFAMTAASNSRGSSWRCSSFWLRYWDGRCFCVGRYWARQTRLSSATSKTQPENRSLMK